MKYKTEYYSYGTNMEEGIKNMLSQGWAIYYVWGYSAHYYITFVK